MTRLRTAILGAGIMGRLHASVVADFHRSELVAVCSRDGNKASALAEQYGARLVFTDYEMMMASPDVDAVIIATPDFAHCDAAVAAAQAGKHILIEKPLTTSVAEADRIVSAVHAAGVTAMTLFNHRWIPAYYQTKQRLVTGDLGQPLMAYARKNDIISVPTEMITWAERTTPSWFLNSHDIDLVSWYFEDQAVEAYASGIKRVLAARGIDTYDAIQAQVRFRGGGIATFESCWIYPNTFPTVVDSWVALTCEQGVIHLDRKQEQIEIAGPQKYEYPRNLLLMQMTGHPQGSVRNAITHWVDCALDGQAPIIALEHSRHITAILEAIHQSLAFGHAVPIV